MEWKTVKLGDILNFRRGHDLPHSEMKDGEIPVAGSNGCIGYHNVATPIEPVITIGRSGNVGMPFFYEKAWAHNTTLYIDDFKGNNPKYLYYLIKTLPLASFGGGSAVPTLNRNHIHPLEVLHTSDRKAQDKIVDILSSLDAKIENNSRINAKLEAQAQALYKSWFVDFEPWGGKMPEDWKEVSLDDMTSKFGTGLNPRKNFKLGEGENYYVTIKNMADNRVYLDERCDKVTDEAIEKINKRSKLQAGDLLFSGIGTIGRVALVTETPTNWNTSESVFNLHPAENISSEFLYVLLLSDEFQQYVKVYAQGGVQQGIRMASLKDYKMRIPGDNLMRQFDEQIIPIISRIKNLEKENDRLAALRDTLLPKLMKGEIDL